MRPLRGGLTSDDILGAIVDIKMAVDTATRMVEQGGGATLSDACTTLLGERGGAKMFAGIVAIDQAPNLPEAVIEAARFDHHLGF